MPPKKPVMSKINATEARQKFGNVIQRAFRGDEHFVVEKNGLPVVVILSVQEYEDLRQAAALQNLDALGRSLGKKATAEGLTFEDINEQVEETKEEIFEELYG